MCSPEELKCIDNINLNSSSCIKSCEGLMVTGYSKQEFDDYSKDYIQKTLTAYKNYKKWFKFPRGIKGFQSSHFLWILIFDVDFFFFVDYEWENRLRYVRIYFDTPTFDRITKDRAAKFVDMLSAIGGTMGLLSGFSIISAVEILYFVAYTVYSLIRKKRHWVGVSVSTFLLANKKGWLYSFLCIVVFWISSLSRVKNRMFFDLQKCSCMYYEGRIDDMPQQLGSHSCRESRSVAMLSCG